MKPENLKTKEEITWCPGCPNFGILRAFQEAVTDLVNEKYLRAENLAIVTGIGCHAKIYDYLNLKGFYGLHGRVLPIALGIKLANPELNVVGFGGDGDTYAEGMEHFVHQCRYNANLTMLVHNNQVFSLTTGQVTPTSEKGFVGASTPFGSAEIPLNPIALSLEAGASFVARGYALDIPHLKDLVKKAIIHKGFSFIDILQPCIIYHNVTPYFQKNVYRLTHDTSNLKAALEKAREWDYSFDKDKKVPIGIFYQTERPTLESQWPQFKKPWHTIRRKISWQGIIREFK